MGSRLLCLTTCITSGPLKGWGQQCKWPHEQQWPRSRFRANPARQWQAVGTRWGLCGGAAGAGGHLAETLGGQQICQSAEVAYTGRWQEKRCLESRRVSISRRGLETQAQFICLTKDASIYRCCSGQNGTMLPFRPYWSEPWRTARFHVMPFIWIEAIATWEGFGCYSEIAVERIVH